MTSREYTILILVLVFLLSSIYGFSYSSKTLARLRKSNDINKHLDRKSIIRVGLLNFMGSLAAGVAMVMIDIQDAPNGINRNAFLYLLCVPIFFILGFGIFLYKVFLFKWISDSIFEDSAVSIVCHSVYDNGFVLFNLGSKRSKI